MYSNNDYRYYLEHQLMESDDFLAHYGVKGMKWKNHNYVIDPRLRERMARGLGGLNRPRANSNPIFQRRNGVSSRLNGARRRAQLGVAKRLIKSSTGRQILKRAAKGKVRREIRKLNRNPNVKKAKKFLSDKSAPKKTWEKQHDFQRKAVNKYKRQELMRKPGKAVAPIKKDINRSINSAKRKAKLKAAKTAYKVVTSDKGKKALKKAGQLATSERGRKILKGAAKLKVKHDVNKLDRKLHRGVNKTVRKAKRSFNKSSVGKTYNDVRKTTRKLGRQIDRQRKINSAKSKARDAYNKATNSETYRQASSTAKRKAKSAYNSAKTGASKAARKAKTQARSTASDIKRTASNAKKKAQKTTSAAKTKARKAYQYVDDHVDRYDRKLNQNGVSYRGKGVTLKTKNSSTDIGGYVRSDTYAKSNGKKKTTSDIGVDIYRNNKKKRKVSYRSVGIGARYGTPSYIYRRNSKKY